MTQTAVQIGVKDTVRIVDGRLGTVLSGAYVEHKQTWVYMVLVEGDVAGTVYNADDLELEVIEEEIREMTELAPNGKEKVTVELVGQDGNAFAIIGRCSKAMRQAGWGTTEIRDFQAKATSGDYTHLLATVMDYCDDASEDEEVEEPYSEDEEN